MAEYEVWVHERSGCAYLVKLELRVVVSAIGDLDDEGYIQGLPQETVAALTLEDMEYLEWENEGWLELGREIQADIEVFSLYYPADSESPLDDFAIRLNGRG